MRRDDSAGGRPGGGRRDRGRSFGAGSLSGGRHSAADRRRMSLVRDVPPRVAEVRAADPGAAQHPGARAVARPGGRASALKAVLLRVKQQIVEDNLGITAAGMAYYFMLAIVPALLTVISIYGLAASPASVERQLESVSRLVPAAGFDVVRGQLRDLVSSSKSGLSVGAAVAALVALWSAAKGAKAMITGIRIAYDDTAPRSSWRTQTLALVFTLGFILFGMTSLTLVTFFPWLVNELDLGWAGRVAASAGRWVVLFVAAVTALAVAYRFAPHQRRPSWRCVLWGSGAAAVMWLVASMGFSWYASSFGSFNETYGSLAGIIVLLLWLEISSIVILLGAEIASELEGPSTATR